MHIVLVYVKKKKHFLMKNNYKYLYKLFALQEYVYKFKLNYIKSANTQHYRYSLHILRFVYVLYLL